MPIASAHEVEPGLSGDPGLLGDKPPLLFEGELLALEGLLPLGLRAPPGLGGTRTVSEAPEAAGCCPCASGCEAPAGGSGTEPPVGDEAAWLGMAAGAGCAPEAEERC